MGDTNERNGTGSILRVPSDLVTVEIPSHREGEPDASFRLPLFETVRRFGEIRQEVINKQGTWDDVHREVAAELKKYGAPDLTLEQAETCADCLEKEALGKKQRRAAARRSLLTSPGSTT